MKINSVVAVLALLVSQADVGAQVAARAQAQEALSAFENDHGTGWAVQWNERTNIVRALYGLGTALAPARPATADDALRAARDLVLAYPDMFGVTADELGRGEALASDQHWFVNFLQQYRGIPVEDGRVRVQLTEGNLAFAGSDAIPGIDLPTVPNVLKDDAEYLAKQVTKFVEGRDNIIGAELLVHTVEEPTRLVPHLAWKVNMAIEQPFSRPRIYVDAVSGLVLEVQETLVAGTFMGEVKGFVNAPNADGHTLPWQATTPLSKVVFPDLTVEDLTLLDSWNGGYTGGQFGFSVSGAGDVNGDGFADVVVGASGYDISEHGKAYVYSGKTGALLFTEDGEGIYNAFGFSVSGAGDVDGDGFADILVGDPFHSSHGAPTGKVYIYSGKTGSLLFTEGGEVDIYAFGRSVAGTGDVNGDGFADFVVGAPASDTSPSGGKAYVYSGKTGALLFTKNAEALDDYFGESVSGAGDVNGDGLADVVVGAPSHDGPAGGSSGKVYVYSGGTGALLLTMDGAGESDHFGGSVSGAGDVNADGFADIVVGAFEPDDFNIHKAYVYSGKTGTLLFSWHGEGMYNGYGESVSGAGDVNGDGFADVVVGDRRHDGPAGGNSGKIYVYSGKTGALLFTKDGKAADGKFGSSVSGAGDVNGDGLADVVVGAAGIDDYLGKAYVYGLAPLIEPTNASGSFKFTSPNVSVAVIASLHGPWVKVQDQAGGGPPKNLSITKTLYAGIFGSLSLNQEKQEPTTAQANAAYYVNRIHSYLKARVPSASGIDFAIPAKVNNVAVDPNDACNAFFCPEPVDLTFMQATPGMCANSSFGTVIEHEYGHFLDHVLGGIGTGLPGGTLSEGIGDLVALFATGQPIIGEALEGPGTWIRHYEVPITSGGSADRKWPAAECNREEHCVAETLGGFVWDLRKNLMASLGSTAGVAAAEQTSLGALVANDSTIPDIVRRVFMQDDTDGKLWNGTPHFADLYHAANAHGFDSTVIPGLPFLLESDLVSVSAASGGSINLALDAGPNLSGRTYFTLASASGTGPGFQLFGVTVPLKDDLVLALSIKSPNSAIFQNTLGVLDAQGKGTSTIVVPPGIVPAGTTLSFATVIFPSPGGAAASVPVSVVIQ